MREKGREGGRKGEMKRGRNEMRGMDVEGREGGRNGG